jgi:hypothetical protein
MTTDAILRTLAVVAAVAILAAPYWRVVVDAVQAAAEWGKAHASTLARAAAAALIVAAAWGNVPLPTFEVPSLPKVVVETPGAEMQTIVAPVAREMAKVPMMDRLLWASVWNKAATVVAGDAVAREVAFTDTRSLRMFTALAIDIAWRRIAGNVPGSNEPLRHAVEAAYAAAMGIDEVPVGKDLRSRYAEFARAMAWAGLNGE